MSAHNDAGTRYKGKVTIVTGGSRGLGRAIVETFDKEGYELESTLKCGFPGKVKFIKCDVTREADIKHFICTTVDTYGRIDCLINNAGITFPVENVDTVTVDMFRVIHEVNLVAPFHVSKIAIPYLRQTNGNIINMCSIVGVIGQNDALAYISAKAGLIGLTKAMAADESKYGVRVNGLSPGPVHTPLLEQIASASKNPEKYLKIREKQQVMNRLGSPDEIAMACLYLAADATYSTGVNLIASGGSDLGFGLKTDIEQML